MFGGINPFGREYLWGETYDGRTGFYDRSYPQGALFVGTRGQVEARLAAAERLQASVNHMAIRYAWPATSGANSNAYYSTLVAAMGLRDVRVEGELWAPSMGRRLVSLAPPDRRRS